VVFEDAHPARSKHEVKAIRRIGRSLWRGYRGDDRSRTAACPGGFGRRRLTARETPRQFNFSLMLTVFSGPQQGGGKAR
jgi:hypothetical protein